MKIAALSDLHGYLPNDIEPADIVVIAGDICPLQCQRRIREAMLWIYDFFIPWAESLPCEKVYVIAGNHDFVFDSKYSIYNGNLISKASDKIVYLEDSGAEYNGIKIYGTPWCQNLYSWAFYSANTYDKYKNIPDDTDLLITHQPPKVGKVGTTNPWSYNERDFGDSNLTRILDEKKMHCIHICGHVHSGEHGGVQYGDAVVYNVSIKSEGYQVAYPVTYIEINDR